MRRIGLIGGTSWLSTAEYYRYLNTMVNKRLGGDDFAKLSLDSLNYGDLNRNRAAGNQGANGALVAAAAKRLAASEAEALLICANTLHMFVPAIEAEVDLPIIHIADAIKAAILKLGLSKVALIGTTFTMDLDLYHSRLRDAGIECIVPCDEDKRSLDSTIFNELAHGEFSTDVQDRYLAMIERLKERGAQGVILGCTEIPLLLEGRELPIPGFDTTKIHAEAAVDFMLS